MNRCWSVWPCVTQVYVNDSSGPTVMLHHIESKSVQDNSATRMHSSRMRTACSLTVSPRILRTSPTTTHVPMGNHACPSHQRRMTPCNNACPLQPRTPPGQNHRRLWKYNLAPTSLRAVKMHIMMKLPLRCCESVTSHLKLHSIQIRTETKIPRPFSFLLFQLISKMAT